MKKIQFTICCLIFMVSIIGISVFVQQKYLGKTIVSNEIKEFNKNNLQLAIYVDGKSNHFLLLTKFVSKH